MLGVYGVLKYCKCMCSCILDSTLKRKILMAYYKLSFIPLVIRERYSSSNFVHKIFFQINFYSN